MMNLTVTPDVVARAGLAHAPTSRSSLVEGVVLHHLRAPEQVARVLHLRDEIDLSAHAAAGPQFIELEKKETSAVSSSVSSSMAS